MHESIAGLVPLLGRALLHFLWQGALIGLLAALALQLLRDARPQARYAVACLALLACVLAPMAYVAWVSMAAPAASAVPAAMAAAATEAGASGRTFAVPLLPVGQAVQGLEELLPRIVLLWAAGACALSLRLAVGVWWIGRLPVLASPHLQRKWQARLDALGARLDVRRAVELRLTMALDSPVVAGCLRPVLLLPVALVARLPVEYLEALLAHELAHVRRHDYLVNLLQGVAEALLFYHPVTWWLSRRIRLEREQVADRLAAEAIGEPRRLALALAALADEQAALRAVPQPALAARGGHLVKRIEQLVGSGRSASGGRFVFPLLGLAAAGLAFYAQAQREPATTVPAASVAAVPATATTPLEAETPAASGMVAATAHAPAAPAPAPRATAAVQAAPVAAPAATASQHGAAPTAPTAPPAPPVPPSRAVPAPPAPPAVPSAGTIPAPPAPPATPSAKPVPAPPAPPRPPATAQVRHHGAGGEPYALVNRGREGYLMSGSSDDMPQIEAARRSLDGDFFWFRRNGQAYVVTDPAVLSRVGRSWSEADALGERMRALGQEMEGHGRRMEAIGREMGKAGGDATPPAGIEAAARQMEALGRQHGSLGERQAQLALAMAGADEKRQAELQQRMRALAREQEALSRKMEAQAKRLEAEAERHQRQMQPMEALSRRMEEATKPMEVLGRQMDGLGRQMDEASQRAERETRQLIAESLDRGLARPLQQRQ